MCLRVGILCCVLYLCLSAVGLTQAHSGSGLDLQIVSHTLFLFLTLPFFVAGAFIFFSSPPYFLSLSVHVEQEWATAHVFFVVIFGFFSLRNSTFHSTNSQHAISVFPRLFFSLSNFIRKTFFFFFVSFCLKRVSGFTH